MDRQRQTDYAVKPRERYHYDADIIQQLYYSYSHKWLVKFTHPVNCVQVLF